VAAQEQYNRRLYPKKYNVKTLVYYEVYENAESAITREKRIKQHINRK
jgi:predicted GIY-YIG superfamily endonuclease